MINLNLLEQLITIADCGTLSAAAEKLNISQPALSRAMQKLEEDLECTLFDRYSNRITLNANGKVAVEKARVLLDKAEDFVKEVQDFCHSHEVIHVSSCALAPLLDLEPILKKLYGVEQVDNVMIDKSELEDALLKNKAQIVIAPYEIKRDDIICVPYIEEDLFVSVPPGHRLADKEEICLRDLDGETMLLYSNIGFWHEMHMRTTPNTHFIYQGDREAFRAIVNASTLPSFTSNMSIKREGKPKDRIIIPISDEDAHVTFHVCIRRKDRPQFTHLLKELEGYYDF